MYKKTVKLLLKFKLEIFFSLLFSIIFTVGSLLSTNDLVDIQPLGKRTLLLYAYILITLWGVFLSLLLVLRSVIKTEKTTPKMLFSKDLSNRRFFLYSWVSIMLFYIPIALLSIGTLSPDSWSSINQIQGITDLSNAHPIIFTGFLSIFIKLAESLGNIEYGILLFSLTQSAILAGVFSYLLTWMRKEKVNKYIILISFIFYAIIPINSMAGLNMWKDILFAGFGLLLLLIIREIYVRKDSFFTIKNVSIFMVLVFLFCTWRNNGLYAYILAIPFILLLNKRDFLNLKYICLFLSPFLLIIPYSLLSSSISKPTSIAESLSVPLHQIARTVKYHPNSISENNKEKINKFLPQDEIKNLYNPGLSDPVKSRMDTNELRNDPISFLQLWLSLLSQQPKTFIAATAYNTYGYFYPSQPSPTTTDLIIDNDEQLFAVEGYVDEPYSNGNKQIVQTYRDTIRSILPFMQNIGTYFCITLIGIYISIKRRRKELIGVFVVMTSLLISTLLGPVNGEFRYLYLLVISTPFIIAGSLVPNKKQHQQRETS